MTKNKNLLKILGKYLTGFYNQADLVLTPSEWTKELLIKSGVKPPIKVISNGVDIKKFKYSKNRANEFRKEYEIGKKEKIVYSVGMVFMRKGIETFSKVAKKMPDVKFIWAGKIYKSILINPKDVERVFKTLPENCNFLGFVRDIIGMHSAGNVFFFPSYAENQGIVILEAAACGKPLVVRNLPVYKTWLFHEKNCMKGESTEDFVDCIRRVLENKRLENRLVERGLRLSRENDVNKTIKQLIGHYENLLNP